MGSLALGVAQPLDTTAATTAAHPVQTAAVTPAQATAECRQRGSLALNVAQPEPLQTTTAPATAECCLALGHDVANQERQLAE